MMISKSIIINAGEYSADAAAALSLFLPSAAVTVGESAVITATRCFDGERYSIKCTDKIEIGYGNYKSLVNALSDISLGAIMTDDGYEICINKESAPDATYRGVMFDNARGIKAFDEFMQDVIFIAKCKANVLHLHLYDSKGCSIVLDSLPKEIMLEGAYTKAQVSEFCEVCRVLGLEIIPEFDLPAHSKNLLIARPDLECRDKNGNPFLHKWTACAGNEKLCALYSDVISELCTLIPCRVFHIGTDELEMTDLPGSSYICYWNDCDVCARYMKKKGIADRQELFYDLIQRVYDIVKSNGKQMMMWSDQIDCTRPCPLPRDIIMHFWRIAAEGRGPHNGCSLEKQVDMGFFVVNSDYPHTYTIHENNLTTKKTLEWDWRHDPQNCDPSKILGGEICHWEYGNTDTYSHYLRSFPTTTALMLDKLYYGNITVDADYRQKNTRLLFGEYTPKGLDIFGALGDIIAPRDGRLYYEESCDRTDIDGIISALERITQVGDFGAKMRAKLFLQNLYAVKSENNTDTKNIEVIV